MVANLLIYKILQLFVIMVIGFVIAKLKIINQNESVVLSRISLYLLMPSAIINAFDFEHSKNLTNGLLFAFAAAIIIHIILYFFDVLYRRFICDNPVERASVMYSNAGNLIIPIVSFVMGDEWVVFSVAYLSVQLFFIWSHGIRLFSKKEKFSIKKVLLNINIIAILLGIIMILFRLRLPNFVKDITSSFGSLLGPLGMLIAGILAANINFKKVLFDKRIYRVMAFRLIAYPAIMLIALKFLSLLPVINAERILLISFLASITPSAATVMQFAQIHESDTEYATAVNIFTTLGCIITMPIFVMLFTNI